MANDAIFIPLLLIVLVLAALSVPVHLDPAMWLKKWTNFRKPPGN